MLVYSFLALACAFCALKAKNKKISICLLLIAFVITAFRGEHVGVDTIKYLNSSYREFVEFEELAMDSNTKLFEVTSNLVYFLIDTFHLPSRIILVFYATVTYIFIYLSAIRFKVHLGYLLPLFILSVLFMHSFNLSRQVATIPVIVVAISYIYESRIKSLTFFGLIIFASTIHFSSISYALLYVLRWVKYDKKVLALITFVVGCLVVLDIFSANNLIRRLAFGQYLDYYGDLLNQNRTVSLLGHLASFIFLSLQVFMLWNSKSKYTLFFAIGCTFSIMMGSLQSYIMRIFLPMTYLVILLYATYATENDKKQGKEILVTLLLFCLLIYTFLSSISSSRDLTPYYFCF